MPFSRAEINIDPKQETDRIIAHMREIVGMRLHKRGAVIGISGGIDSSVCLALSAKAFGPERVLGLTMPESDSNPESAALARKLARTFAVPYLVEDMTRGPGRVRDLPQAGRGHPEGLPRVRRARTRPRSSFPRPWDRRTSSTSSS